MLYERLVNKTGKYVSPFLLQANCEIVWEYSDSRMSGRCLRAAMVAMRTACAKRKRAHEIMKQLLLRIPLALLCDYNARVPW
ncbi:MAG: hypothetical protein ACKVS6_10455 [Planctomycetota bacterium]